MYYVFVFPPVLLFCPQGGLRKHQVVGGLRSHRRVQDGPGARLMSTVYERQGCCLPFLL